jgi:hypothetical protein
VIQTHPGCREVRQVSPGLTRGFAESRRKSCVHWRKFYDTRRNTTVRPALGRPTRSSGIRKLEYFFGLADPELVWFEMDICWAYVAQFRWHTYTDPDGVVRESGYIAGALSASYTDTGGLSSIDQNVFQQKHQEVEFLPTAGTTQGYTTDGNGIQVQSIDRAAPPPGQRAGSRAAAAAQAAGPPAGR